MRARNGVFAAQLAKSGFTSNSQTLEVRNGFFRFLLSRRQTGHKQPLMTWVVSMRWRNMGCDSNHIPCGGLTHTAIYATIKMRNDHQIAPANVEHVQVDVPADTAAPLVLWCAQDRTGRQVFHALLIARALIDGTNHAGDVH
jgi:2-methylcitrate dehydratase PrpD